LLRGREFVLLAAGMDHIARTGIYTRGIFYANAGFSDYV
jgi:hypothetical protein